MMVRILHLALAVLALVSLGSKYASAQQNLLSELYGMGVHAYNSQDYETAHEYLTAAIDQGCEDPRCYFFRGLTCLELDRSDEAEADFAFGAELEYGDFERSYPVGTSLHRVQGTYRLMIEDHRRRSRVAALQRAAESQETRLTQHRGNENDVLRDPNVVPATEQLPVPEGDVVDPFGDSDQGDGATAPAPQVVDQPDFGPIDGPEGPGEEPNPFAPGGNNPPTDQPPVDEPFNPGNGPDDTDLFNPPVDIPETDQPPEVDPQPPEIDPLFPAEPDLPGDGGDADSADDGGVVGSIFGALRRALPRVSVPEIPGLGPGVGPGGDFDAPPGDFPFDPPEVDPFGLPGEEDAQVDPFGDDDGPADAPGPADDPFGDDLFDN